MIFRLKVDCASVPFQGRLRTELARILRDLASRIEGGESFANAREVCDANGYICGAAFLRQREGSSDDIAN